jgi:hypothetical protein
MQTVSIYHILTYYTAFQRIAWLLLQHAAITEGAYSDLVDAINGGFFGIEKDEVPALTLRLRRHLQRVWKEEWLATEVPVYAWGSWMMSLARRSEGYVTKEGDSYLLRMQDPSFVRDLHILCGLAISVGLEGVDDVWGLAEGVEDAYGEPGEEFAAHLMASVKPMLIPAHELLGAWIQRLSRAVGDEKSSQRKQRLLQARVDCALADMDVLALLERTESQINLCSDLIFWMRRAGDVEGALRWSRKLVEMLQELGKGTEAVKAMFDQGRDLFFDREYEQAAQVLRQASLLAEHVQEGKVARNAQRYLEHAEYFLG